MISECVNLKQGNNVYKIFSELRIEYTPGCGWIFVPADDVIAHVMPRKHKNSLIS